MPGMHLNEWAFNEVGRISQEIFISTNGTPANRPALQFGIICGTICWSSVGGEKRVYLRGAHNVTLGKNLLEKLQMH